MNPTRRLWIGLLSLLAIAFSILLWAGHEIHLQAPPIPERVVASDGTVLYTRAQIERGRQAWQSTGGQQLGSIWGHGAYIAPDWSADFLHREATALLDTWSRHENAGTPYAALSTERRAALEARLRERLRPNTYDPSTQAVTVDAEVAAAIRSTAAHYESLYGHDGATAALRKAYAMKEDTLADPGLRHDLTAFYWWAAWAAVTERPGAKVSYTNNWPADPTVGNEAPASAFLWTVFSVLFLIAGIGLLGWHHARSAHESTVVVPDSDPLAMVRVTPSMRAVAKYFWVVIALFLVQILLGALTAHYQVEGQSFYGFPLASVLPASLTRTWHTQLAVLWIATAWLGTGLYLAPALSGHEPKFQRLGVNFLFSCLLVIVVGAFAGQWLAVMQKLGLGRNFWFGHQGWEYVDLGRFWQWFLFIGLALWLVLVGRALWPLMHKGGESKPVVTLLFLSTVAIGLFYGAGLLWNEHTHISMVEYWRWWVVHLWVEGFFEVFATAAIALIFTRLGLVRASTATNSLLFATIVFMGGGVLGTLHHLYFTGTPTAILALGASFSALEVVPLAYLGVEAYQTYRLGLAAPWMQRYRWPILFFTAVSFWNLVGAGLFGFLINPPLALYYMQGLNLTPLHGHTALFGVYGMLGIGLMLFCLRGMKPAAEWADGWLRTAFWAFNVGLAAMALLTLLPLGIIQVTAAIQHGYWYARSADLLQSPTVQLLVWLRVPGDTLFSIGALSLAGFVAMIWLRRRKASEAGEGSVSPVK